MPRPKGYRHSAETRAEISKALRGRIVTDEARANLSKAMRGKNRGKQHSAETRRKMSEAQRGLPKSLRSRAVHSLSKRGFLKPHTEEQILDAMLRLRHRPRPDRDYCKHNRMTRVEIVEFLGERDGWLCQHDECPERDADQSVPGVRLTPTTCHVDHHHPVAHGGSNDLENLRLLHPSCNCSKGAKWEEAVRQDMVCLESAPTPADKIEALGSRSVRSAPRLSEGSDHPIFFCRSM